MFDLICGTSVGGIIALGLYCRIDLPHYLTYYENLGKQVYHKGSVNKSSPGFAFLSNGYLYDAEILKNNIKNTIGENKTFNDYNPKYPKVFVVSTPKEEKKPYLFRNYSGENSIYDGTDNSTIVDACMATSASPIYFESYKIDKIDFNDGALVANNPTHLALRELEHLYRNKNGQKFNIDCVVSLGSGLLSDDSRPRTNNNFQKLFDMVENLVQRCTDSETIHREVKYDLELRLVPYFRFNPPGFGDIPIDSDDNDVIGRMLSKTDEYITNENELFERCSRLL